jgi:hypothetical protein
VVATDALAQEETEPLAIQPDLIGEPFAINAIDLNRHAAEKYHACVRIYANSRTSTRVKDLVDLVLLIEGGWLQEDRVGAALVRVFRERNDSQPPPSLPDRPPNDWLVAYPKIAAETGATVGDALAGWALASSFYGRAMAQKGPK